MFLLGSLVLLTMQRSTTFRTLSLYKYLWVYLKYVQLIILPNIHCISLFPQSTGWPGVVSVMGNWLGIRRRGLVMGVWNAHTSVGNILGTAIPAIWAVRGGNW